jgi:hypothetical protein
MDVQKRFEEIRAQYSVSLEHFTALVSGFWGTGKTTLLATGRLPVLVDSFDPKGPIVLRKAISEGKVLVRDWSGDNSKSPSKYKAWEDQWEKDIDDKFLTNFGTYAIDSYTTFQPAMVNYIGMKNKRPQGQIAQGDYLPLYATLRDIIGRTSEQGCDFIMTAHLQYDKDEYTGEILANIDAFKKLVSEIPLLFSERYVINKEQSGKDKYIYELLTNDKARFRASSRLNSEGIFKPIEEPNIKKLLEKAGFNTQDKPLFI